MRHTLIVKTLLVLTLLPAASPGQTGGPQARIDAALSEAARLKLPVSVLTNKVAEGQAKHIPIEKIAVVVEARLAGLKRASDTVQRLSVPLQNAAELALVADALDAGVKESIAIGTLRNAPQNRRELSLAVLTELARSGTTSEAEFVAAQRILTSPVSLNRLLIPVLPPRPADTNLEELLKRLKESLLNGGIAPPLAPVPLAPVIVPGK